MSYSVTPAAVVQVPSAAIVRAPAPTLALAPEPESAGNVPASVIVSWRKSANDTSLPTASNTTWDGLLDSLADPASANHRREKLEGPLFSPARFDGEGKKGENVLDINFGVLDLDDVNLDTLEAVGKIGNAYDCLLYTTWSHHECPQGYMRARLLVPFTRPVLVTEWPALWARFSDLFSANDPHCKNSGRGYFTPGMPLGHEQTLKCRRFGTRGRAIDVDALLALPQPGGVALSGDATASGSEATDIATTFDFDSLGYSWKQSRDKKKQRWGELILKVSEGQVIATQGDRNDKMVKFTLAIVRARPYWSTESIADFFSRTLHAMGEPTIKDFKSMIDRARVYLAEKQKKTDEYKRSDRGNAERLVAEYGHLFRYVPEFRKFIVWDGTRWVRDADGQVQRWAKYVIRTMYAEAKNIDDSDRRKEFVNFVTGSESAPRLHSMVELAKTEEGVPVTADKLDANPWLFNAANGTIDLRTGELRAHDPKDLITKLSPVPYDPGAKSDLWFEFLVTTTGGDTALAAFLQRSAGYAAQGTAREKAWCFSYGPRDSGKGTFNDAIAYPLGDYHVNSESKTWLHSHDAAGGNRGDLVRLRGARLVTASEFHVGARFSESTVKKFTGGGDEVTAAAKYQDEISYIPQALLWFQANDAPKINSDDEAMWNRMRRIPFSFTIPEEKKDPHLKDKLQSPEVASAILAWIVRGCLVWQTEGLKTCPAVEASNAEYRSEMDRLSEFLDECCKLDPAAKPVSSDMLYRHYTAWCERSGIRAVLEKAAFGKRLAARGFKPYRSASARGWNGIELIHVSSNASFAHA